MRKYKNSLSRERLKQLYCYSPDMGIFLDGRCRKVGKTNRLGYVVINIDKKAFLAHRLAWLFIHGEFPEQDIDHKNGKRSDNRIKNLRLATASQNIANSKRNKNNKTGFKGVSYDGLTKRYKAYIQKNGKTIHLGAFYNAKDASNAYIKAAKTYFGEFTKAA